MVNLNTQLKSIYSIWICMDTKKTDDSIIEFGMKSNLIYGKIKKIPKLSKINGALINVRTRTAKNRELSKNRLIAMLEELFSKSEFLEKKKILEEDYGLKMSVELEGRMNEMCNVSDYWEEVALQTGRKEGREEGREEGRKKQAMKTALKLKKKGHSLEDIAECVDFDVETVRKWLVS